MYVGAPNIYVDLPPPRSPLWAILCPEHSRRLHTKRSNTPHLQWQLIYRSAFAFDLGPEHTIQFCNNGVHAANHDRCIVETFSVAPGK
jgi:hypothetical protein